MKLTNEFLKENCDVFKKDITEFYIFLNGTNELYLRPCGGGNENGYYWGFISGDTYDELHDCKEIHTLQDLKILKTMCLGNRDDRDMLVKTLFLDLSIEECLDLYKIKLDIEKQKLSDYAKSLG